MYGDNRTVMREFEAAITELEELKIEIPSMPEDEDELDEKIEQLENQIRLADEELLYIENEDLIFDEMFFSENSNLNILIQNIEILVDRAWGELDRQTAEDAERQAFEEQNRPFVGTYRSSDGDTMTIVMNEDGSLTWRWSRRSLNFY